MCSKFLDFEIQNFQTISDVDILYTKVVILNTIYKFIVEMSFFKLFRVPNICLKFLDFEIENLEVPNHLEYLHG